MKKILRCMFTFIFATMVMAIISHLPASAHSLTPWARHYTMEKAGGDYHFAISDSFHIDGDTANYIWANEITETLFIDSLYRGLSMWGGLIKILEVPSPEEAHLKITYDPDPATSKTYILIGGENHYHYGGDYSDIITDPEGKYEWYPQIIFNYDAAYESEEYRLYTTAHELGHVWGIEDLYKLHDDLDSIYCHKRTVTRHDLNAMRICLGNPEFETADGRWKYQKSPNVWAENEWVNGYYYNSEGYRTTAYKIYLDLNDGTGDIDMITALPNSHLPQIYTPYRKGYTFEGYYDTSAASGGTKYYNADGTSARPWDKSSNATLYARWKLKSYTVTLDPKGGTGGTQNISVAYGGSLPPITPPTRTGYVFDGYSISYRPFSGDFYYDSQGLPTRTWDMDSDYPMTLYAQWTPNKYTITLNKNGGTGGTDSVTATFDFALPTADMPSREGYTFEGYFDTSAASGGTQYYDADGTATKKWVQPSNATLYARWTPKTYTVTLNPNGGTGGTQHVTATFGENMPAIVAPNRTGYKFSGYFDTDESSGGKQYYNAYGISTHKWDKTSNATLCARWTPKVYVISYDANGGSGAPDLYLKSYGVDLTLSTIRPKKDNAFFLGWATSPTAAQPDYQPGDTYTAEGDAVLYAVYTDVTDLAITADGVAGADGTIQSPDGVDVYKFTAPKSGSYQIYFSNISGGTAVNVYDADQEPVNHTLHYYDLTGGQAYYVEVINPTAGQYLYSLHVDMSTESHYYMDSSEGNIWLTNDFYGNLYSDNRAGTLFRIDKASADGSLAGYMISADRMYDFYDHNITIPASSPQYLTYTPSTLTRPDPAGGKASMEPYSGTGGQRWDISQLPGSNEYFITSTEGTLEQLLILNTQMPRPFMVSKTAYSSCQEARFTFSSRIDMPVENGTYRIANQSTNLSLGVQSGNVLHSDNQDIWDIEWQDNGFYKICWHSDPHQVLTYDADKKRGILDTDAGRNNQMWKIARCADGSLRISPANSYKVIAVNSMTDPRSSIRGKDDTFDASGKWSFTQIITDGIYEIQGKTSGKLIHAEHTLNGAPAHLWQPAETLYQKMRFERLDDGAYRITMLSGDGRVLTNPQSTSNGTELEFRDWTGADYQRWFVVDCGDGYFKLVNKYSRLVVDISENGTANDTKIQQWADAGVDAQRFKLLRTNLPFTSKILNDSTYEIQGKTSQKLIHAANWPNGSPAHLWESADINLQKMHFDLLSDGTYRITVLNGNGGVLTNPESYTEGTQLLFSAWTGGDHQRWYAVDLGNGYVKLINKFSGMVIDISENGTANGTKVQQWKDKNTDTDYVDAQQFRLLPTNLPFESMDLADGTYEIQAASGKLLHAADWTDGSKAHLWESVENNPLQTMHFERQSDGTYEITVDATGNLLTNPYSYVNGTQLEFSSQAHDDHQKWYVVDDGDGYVTLINKFSGLAIDVSENGTANGTRIQQWQDTGVSAQRFRLHPVA